MVSACKYTIILTNFLPPPRTLTQINGKKHDARVMSGRKQTRVHIDNSCRLKWRRNSAVEYTRNRPRYCHRSVLGIVSANRYYIQAFVLGRAETYGIGETDCKNTQEADTACLPLFMSVKLLASTSSPPVSIQTTSAVR